MICCPVTFFVPALIEPLSLVAQTKIVWAGRHVILYTSVLYVPVLACAGIGQDLAFSDFLTLSVCSRNIAMTIKKIKKHVLEVKYINSGQKKTLSAIFVRQILYTIKDQQPTYFGIFVSDTRLRLLPAKKSSSSLCRCRKRHLLLHVLLVYT